MPGFLVYFAIAVLAVAVICISITRMPLGIGWTMSAILSAAAWVMLLEGLWFVATLAIESPFSISS